MQSVQQHHLKGMHCERTPASIAFSCVLVHLVEKSKAICRRILSYTTGSFNWNHRCLPCCAHVQLDESCSSLFLSSPYFYVFSKRSLFEFLCTTADAVRRVHHLVMYAAV